MIEQLRASSTPLSIEGQAVRHYQHIDQHIGDQHIDHRIDTARPTSGTPKIKKPTAHFYGGNGFAVGTYLPLLSALAEHLQLSALSLRGCWYDKPTAKKLTRQQDAEALVSYLEQTQDQPIVGIGHSQGATATAIAAAMRPDLFSHLYLIEPVTFTKWQSRVYDLIPSRLKIHAEPFKSTLSKQSVWHSAADYYQYLRQHRAYKRIDDEPLAIYAQNSLQATADGRFELIFSPEQELANYFGTPYVNDALRQLNGLGVPYDLLIGKPSLFISDKVRKQWQHFVPEARIHLLPDYGHLLPFEAPELCAQKIIELMQKTDAAKH